LILFYEGEKQCALNVDAVRKKVKQDTAKEMVARSNGNYEAWQVSQVWQVQQNV